jgi:L-aspartate oxidase
MSKYSYDFLVIGSGVAGLAFALEAARTGRVGVVTKREAAEGSTSYAQGGVACVRGGDDSFDLHGADTEAAGAGLCRPEVVESVVAEAPGAIAALERWGVRFSLSDGGGSYDLGREGGHARRRILHAEDATGRVIEDALLAQARGNPRIELIEHQCAVDLLTRSKVEGRPAQRDRTRVLGVYVHDAQTGEIRALTAPRVLLATGGAGKVYRYTTNPDVACGDGMAIAYRAGARLANLEFVQFHPTCLFHPRATRFLISEAVRGEGAVLRNLAGDAFMPAYHPQADLAPRDVVARAIDQEMKRRAEPHVLLDLAALSPAKVRKRFPNIHRACLELGIDITRQPIPVVPAAHYMCGGVVTDGAGRTDLVGLFAAGEVACTGLHGANRLASNSLLESVVFARRAAQAAAALPPASPAPEVPPWDPGKATVPKESILVSAHWTMVRALMWDFVGIVRSDHRLQLAAGYIHDFRRSVENYYWNFILDTDLIELRNLTLLADLIIRAAAIRRESRGLHFNVDHPQTDDATWKRETVLDPIAQEARPAEDGELRFGSRDSTWEPA